MRKIIVPKCTGFHGEPYNECADLIEQVENYRTRYGHNPEAVCSDK
jgi:hypothetical protein